MNSNIINFILVLGIGFIIFCIYSLVRIHDRAIQLSNLEDIQEAVKKEKITLERLELLVEKKEEELKKLTEEIEEEKEAQGIVEEDTEEDTEEEDMENEEVS